MKTSRSNLLFIITLVMPLAGVLAWSVEPAARSMFAKWSLGEIEISSQIFTDVESNKKFKRSLQKHFLKYQTYIPLEDIITLSNPNHIDMFTKLMKDACGKSKLYIWMPISFRLPLVKVRTWEFCWKPKIKIT